MSKLPIKLTNGLSDPSDQLKMPIMRGTYGLWKNYPVIKQNRILFEQLQAPDFFKNFPSNYWYVYGDMYNKMKAAEAHSGYSDLGQIIDIIKP